MAVVVFATHKRCTVCGTVKPLDDFYAAERMRDGRQSRCKACANVYQAGVREERKKQSLLRDRQSGGNGEIGDESLATRRDQYIVMLAAAIDRWREEEDVQDRDSAREAVLFRCRQLLEAERLVTT